MSACCSRPGKHEARDRDLYVAKVRGSNLASSRVGGVGHDRLGSEYDPKRAHLAACGLWRDFGGRVCSSFKKIDSDNFARTKRSAVAAALPAAETRQMPDQTRQLAGWAGAAG